LENVTQEPLRDSLVAGAASLGVPLDDRAVERFEIYLRELVGWNQQHNLTAIRTPGEIITRHFLDSLSCVAAYDFTAGRPIIDIGAGAGFPGLPLKIAFPDLELVLIDASIKKVEFLRHLCPLLGFTQMDIVHVRAEELAHAGAYRQRFHLALARAVAPLAVLAEYCLPFVTVGGYFIAQKNSGIDAEIAEAAPAIETLGGGRLDQIAVAVPGDPTPRALIRIRKENPTPSSYPRRPGMPAKRPLSASSRRRTHPKYKS